MDSNSKALPQGIKYKNKKLILNYIKNYHPTYRSTISRELNISKPTVSSIVEELIAEGWIKETTEEMSDFLKVGRKPIQLIFNNNAGYIIGIDIGGTNTTVAISDLNGEIIKKEIFQTNKQIETNLLKKIQQSVDKIIKEAQVGWGKVLGLGIGVPGIVDVYTGLVIDAPSLGWINYPLKEEAERLFDLPVYVDNDVNVGILGEQWKGSARNKNNALLISIGTGVGCGILLNNRLFRGSEFGAGEIGYMVTNKDEAKRKIYSPFNNYGFLDNKIGGPSIIRRMKQELVSNPSHPLEKNKTWGAKVVFDHAMNGDYLSTKVINEFIEHLSFAIVNITSILNPEVVLLGGGVSKSGYWYLKRVDEVVNSYVPFKTKIELTTLGDNLGVIGAASLFLKEYEGVFKL